MQRLKVNKVILSYVAENNLSWVEDSSNTTDKYTRNFFRHKIIPAIAQHFPNVKANLLEDMHRLKETETLYQQAIELHKKRLLEYKSNEIHIPVLKLQKTKPLDTVIWEIIKPYNFRSKQTDEIKKLFGAGNSSYVQSSSHRIIKNRNWLIISPNNTNLAENILIEENDKVIEYQNGKLKLETISTTNYKLQTTNDTASLDSDEIIFPLLLRKWKQGDYFYPLGMQKKKKLSRFFIEYSLNASTILNYDTALEMIVFDHVAPQNKNASGATFSYVPDGTYEGFLWKSNRWNWVEKVFTFAINEDDNPPIPAPLFGKPKHQPELPKNK